MALRNASSSLVLLGALSIVLCAGCNTAAPTDPFDPSSEENVQIEGLPLVAAGAVGQAGESLSDFFHRITGGAPGYVEYARTLNDPDARPDDRREALLGLAQYEFGQREPYLDAYQLFAENAEEPLTQAAAIRAINLSRDADSADLLVEALGEESPLVRLEAAKALGNLPTADAAAELLKRAMDPEEDLDVRIAAIEALGHYGDPTTKRSLAGLLEAGEFSVVWQARHTLVRITGEDHGFDIDAWRRAIG